MTTGELIAMLQQLDPAAVVVVPAYSDLSDFSGPSSALGLQPGFVRTVNLREVQSKQSWFDPLAGAPLFEIDDDGDVQGVEIG